VVSDSSEIPAAVQRVNLEKDMVTKTLVMAKKSRQRSILRYFCLFVVIGGLAGGVYGESQAQRRYTGRITRAAFQTIHLPDSTGKMEPAYLIEFRSSVSVKNLGTNAPAKVFPAEVIINERARNPKSGAMPWAYRQTLVLDTVGVYEVTRSRYYRTESGSSANASPDYWLVTIVWPRSVSPIRVDNLYYPGEHPTISFVAAELTDLASYSYEIVRLPEMTKVDSGKGGVIHLSRIVNEIENAKFERRFEIRGFYRGRPFKYLSPGDSVPHPTVWTIQVKRPTFAGAVMWDPNGDTPVSELPELPMNLKGGYNPRTFGYYYYGRKGSSLIITDAKITNLQIQSNPPEFLRGWTPPVQNGVYADIAIIPDEGFVSAGTGSGQVVELTIKFNTQYGPEKPLVYRAVVY
jgi:hypothetical protein